MEIERSAGPRAGADAQERAARAGKTALVLEGGSYRAQFTAGVLDVLMERGVSFDACYAVSAGVLCAMNLKSHQIGRTNRINLAFCDDRRYMGLYSLATTGSMVGYGFMLGELQEVLDPFDRAAFSADPMRLWATATDALYGDAVYLAYDDPVEDIDAVRATTSLPLITPLAEVGGRLYCDGGVADSVPVEQALERDGYGRAVVVLTQDRSYVKGPYELMGAARARYGADYPYLLEAISTRHERYNAQRERIWSYERAGRALVVAPPEPVEVGHVEHSAPKLLGLYIQGRREAERLAEKIAAFAAPEAEGKGLGTEAPQGDLAEEPRGRHFG